MTVPTVGHRARLPVVAAAGLALVLLGGCAADRIAAPNARLDPGRPTFVIPGDDPAEDPQLAAVELPKDRPGAASPHTIETLAEDLEKLPAVVEALKARLGDDARSVQVDVSSIIDVYVPAEGGVDHWSTLLDELRSTPLQGSAAEQFDGEPFALADIDVDPAVRVAVGIARRVPGAGVDQVSLSTSDDPLTNGGHGLAWRFTVTRGGRSLVVVADVHGEVLEVRS